MMERFCPSFNQQERKYLAQIKGEAYGLILILNVNAKFDKNALLTDRVG